MKVSMCLFLAVTLLPAAHAQSTSVTQRGTSSSGQAADPYRPVLPGVPRDAAEDDEATNAYFRRHVEQARKLDRKKRMVDTANRLLALTKQLQDDLKGRAPTPEDDKRLDEIARLARQVKDQMRQ